MCTPCPCRATTTRDDPTSTTAVVAVGGSIRTYIMRTSRRTPAAQRPKTTTLIKVALQSGVTRYRFVWDVACLHEGLIYILNSAADICGPNDESLNSWTISRETDGWCTDLTAAVHTAHSARTTSSRLNARGSDFPGASRYPFKGVWGTLTVERIS